MLLVASLIVHSELFPGSSAVLVLLGVNANGHTMRPFFPFLSFFFHPPHFGVAP